MENNYKIISFGHRCSSASILRTMNLKMESYPFDWLVSKLDVIKDCIETNFIHFKNTSNYTTNHTETYNMIDGKKYLMCKEVVEVNSYYDAKSDEKEKSTYEYKLALNHYNLKKEGDYEYYERCIKRLYDLLASDITKYYLYFHPIMGIEQFQKDRANILKQFEEFTTYIQTKTTNLFGIYFVLIKDDAHIAPYKLYESANDVVYVIDCNRDFLDGGDPFLGNMEREKNEIVSILRGILPK